MNSETSTDCGLLNDFDVEVRHVRGKGRTLFTTRRFRAGEVVLQSNACAFVASAERLHSMCNQCFSDCESLKRCSVCKAAWFCGRTCQLAAWKQHKRLCFSSESDWLQSETANASDEARLLDCVLDLADSEVLPPVFNKIPRPSQTDVLTMPDSTHPTASDALLARLVLDRRRARCKAKKWPHNHPTETEVVKMIGRMKCNNFSIWNDLLVPVGSGCYPAGALLNHSCEPDCVITYDLKTKVQTFRAIRDVEAGSEVTHSYLDIAEATHQRKEYLLEHYGFECVCSRCEAADKTLDDSLYAHNPLCENGDWTRNDNERINAAKELIAKVSSGEFDLEETGREIEMLENALDIHTKYLHRNNLHRLKCLCTLHTSYLSYGLFSKDIAVLQEIIHVYSVVYPTNHPMIGLMQYTLGDVRMAVGQETQNTTEISGALLSYRSALDSLTISHGAESELCRNLAGLIMQYTQGR